MAAKAIAGPSGYNKFIILTSFWRLAKCVNRGGRERGRKGGKEGGKNLQLYLASATPEHHPQRQCSN